jgi:hypothetical protein
MYFITRTYATSAGSACLEKFSLDVGYLYKGVHGDAEFVQSNRNQTNYSHVCCRRNYTNKRGSHDKPVEGPRILLLDTMSSEHV